MYQRVTYARLPGGGRWPGTFIRPVEPDEYGFRFLREVPRVRLANGRWERVPVVEKES